MLRRINCGPSVAPWGGAANMAGIVLTQQVPAHQRLDTTTWTACGIQGRLGTRFGVARDGQRAPFIRADREVSVQYTEEPQPAVVGRRRDHARRAGDEAREWHALLRKQGSTQGEQAKQRAATRHAQANSFEWSPTNCSHVSEQVGQGKGGARATSNRSSSSGGKSTRHGYRTQKVATASAQSPSK